VFIRGGRIVPIRQRVRRASSLMANDPFTLIIALDNNVSIPNSLFNKILTSFYSDFCKRVC